MKFSCDFLSNSATILLQKGEVIFMQELYRLERDDTKRLQDVHVKEETMTTVDIRSEISQTISSITPLDNLEQEHIRFVLDWIKSGSEIFRLEKPATPEIHLVSYFVVASPEIDRVLLVDHRKAELWLPPGGHVEPGDHEPSTKRGSFYGFFGKAGLEA